MEKRTLATRASTTAISYCEKTDQRAARPVGVNQYIVGGTICKGSSARWLWLKGRRQFGDSVTSTYSRSYLSNQYRTHREGLPPAENRKGVLFRGGLGSFHVACTGDSREEFLRVPIEEAFFAPEFPTRGRKRQRSKYVFEDMARLVAVHEGTGQHQLSLECQNALLQHQLIIQGTNLARWRGDLLAMYLNAPPSPSSITQGRRVSSNATVESNSP